MTAKTRDITRSRRILVNGVETETEAGNLGQLLAVMDLTGASVATALNGDFVPAAARGGTVLRAGDRVEIVAPRQGG